jgi:hypothetical protein
MRYSPLNTWLAVTYAPPYACLVLYEVFTILTFQTKKYTKVKSFPTGKYKVHQFDFSDTEKFIIANNYN